MADYLEMYKTLFQTMTQAINILQEAQRKTEEMYISAEQPNIVVINSDKLEWSKPKLFLSQQTHEKNLKQRRQEQYPVGVV